MDPISITAASGLRSRMESLDMLGNNLANAATAGYKRDSEFYSLYMSETAMDANADFDPAVAVLPVIERAWTDFAQGVLQNTGNPLDLALSGPGFFAVNGPDGPLYTRNGGFRISANGEVQTAEGYAIRLAGGAPLLLTSSESLTVASDGSVHQAGQLLGRLETVTFDDPAELQKVGHSYYRSASPAAGTGEAEVLQGKLEGSNVSTAESAVRLVNVMRQFEMLNKAVTISGEMNRKAVEEVARVGS